MRKILLSLMAVALLAGSVYAAADSGGRKKARKKAKTECKVENCDPRNCDPRNCDPKNCKDGSKTTCLPATCSGK